MKFFGVCYLILALTVLSPGVLANPIGGVVTSGQAQITQPNKNTVQINQSSQKAVINWQTFNIQAGQSTQFFQPNSSAIALNLINSMNGSSSIFGNLLANGQVWLVNPAGIVFGKGARVNVGGLLATTSEINKEDFLSGKYKFTNTTSHNGAIINNGTIQVPPGGLVALIGNSVDNKGLIQAKMGTVVLAGARAYTLDFDGDQLINFTIQQGPGRNGKAIKNTINNSGLIDTGMGATLGPRAAKSLVESTINTSGVTQASHVASRNGIIVLDAGGGTARVSGKLIAKGGAILVKAKHLVNDNALITTSGDLNGGSILLNSTDLNSSNTTISANGSKTGGEISLLGKTITIANTKIQANGPSGGGQILIGGNFQGSGPQPNALNTSVDKNTQISANALTKGNGGKIIIWSDNFTSVSGSLSAKGGLLGGNGGLIETSGHNNLAVNGIKIDTSAPYGETGTWLLDPANVTIANNGGANTNDTCTLGTCSPNSAVNTAIVDTTILTNNLSLTNAIVTTTNTGTQSTSAGTITVTSPITWSTGNTLTLTAASDIAINASITTGTAASRLILNSAGTVTQSAASIIGGAGGLTKMGAGTAILSQINTYSGPTTVTTGTLSLTNVGALGSSSGTTVSSGASLSINLGSQTLSNTNLITLNGAGIGNQGALFKAGSGTSDIVNNPISMASATGIGVVTGGSLQLNGVISSTGINAFTVNQSGTAGTLRISNIANTFTGPTTVSAGTLSVAKLANRSATSSLGAPVSIANGTITLGSNGNTATLIDTDPTATASNRRITVTGTGTANGIFQWDGTGNLALSGAIANSATGGLTLQTTNTGTLALSGGITNTNPLTFITTASGSITKSGSMTGAGTVTLGNTNAGMVTFSGSHTNTGATAVNAGTLFISSAGGLGSAGSRPVSLTIANGAQLSLRNVNLNGVVPLTLNGGTGVSGSGALVATIGNATYPGAITLNAGSTIGLNGGTFTLSGGMALNNNSAVNFTGAGNANVTGVIANGTGTTTGGSLVKDGTGTVTLSRANTYTGDTTINTGSLTVGIANAVGSSSDVILANTAGAVFNLAGFSDAIGSLSGGGAAGGNVTLGVGTLTTGGNNATTTYSGVISGNGALVKSGTGVMTLAGSNIYRGTTTVSVGTLNLTNINALGSGATESSSTSVTSGATLSLNLGGATLANNNTITLNGAGVGNQGALFEAGTSGVDITSNPISMASATGIGVATGGTLQLGAVISSTGINAFTVNQSGTAGTLRISGIANTFTGPTTVSAGTLSVAKMANTSATSSLGAPTTAVNGTITLGSNGNTATLINTDAAATASNRQITTTGTGAANGIFQWDGTGNLALSGLITNSAIGGLTLETTNTGTLALSGGITLNNNSAVSFSGAGNANVSGVIANGTGTTTGGGLIKNGGGTVTLSAANTYTGTTTINTGSLTAGIANAVGSSSSVILANTAGAVFNLAGFNDTIGSLSGGGAAGGNVTLGAGTLNTGGNNASTTYSGVISGSGALIKSGTGIMTLAGSNIYTGTTTISVGTLNLTNVNALGSGATQSSSTSVTSSATLSTNFATGILGNTNALALNGIGVGGNGALQSGADTDTLSNTITLDSDTTIGGTGSLVLNGTVDGTFALTVQGLNSITFGAAIGNTNALTSLNATANTLSFNNVKTTGAQSYTGSTNTTLNGTYLTAGGTFAVTGPTLLGGAVSVDTTNAGGTPTGAAINFGSINNAQTLNLTSGNGSINLNGVLGGATPLTSLTATSTGASNDIIFANNVNTVGAINITAGRNVTLSSGTLNSSSGNVALTGTAGLVQETGTGFIHGGLLTTHSVGGTTLNAANTVTSFNGTNTSSGAIALTNTAAPLTITGISQSGGGSITIANTGALTNSGAITTTTNGAISLTATGGTETISAAVTANGSGAITLSATGASSDILFNANVSSTTGSFLATAGHNINIGSTAALTGGPITLVASNAFINNNPGAAVLNPSAGNRFLVYSVNPANDTRGNLVYNFKQYNATYNVTTVLGSGNGLLYSVTPIITPILTGTSSKVYNTNTAATLAAGNYSSSDAIDGDTITLNNLTSGTYASKNVGTNIGVSTTGIAIASATNSAVTIYGYTLSSTTASANIGTITPAPLTITPNSGQGKTYGTSDTVGGFTYTNIGLYAGDSISGNLGRAAGENVSNYAYNLGNLSNTNYTISLASSPPTFAITPASLTINPTVGQTVAYGVSDPAAGFTYTNTGLINGVSPYYWNSSGAYVAAAQINDTLSGKLGRAAGQNVGNYAYSVGTVAVSAPANYNTTLTPGTFAITPAPLVATITNQFKIYGANDPFISGVVTALQGLVNTTVNTWNSSGQYITAPPINDTGNVSSTLVSLVRVSGETVANSPYPILAATFTPLSGSAIGNYTEPTYTSGSSHLTIAPASLIVNAQNASKLVGEPNPPFLYSETGLITNSSVTDWMNVTTPINDNITGSLISLSNGIPGTFAQGYSLDANASRRRYSSSSARTDHDRDWG